MRSVGLDLGVRHIAYCEVADGTFDSAVAYAMDCISTADLRAWTLFSGYSLAST